MIKYILLCVHDMYYMSLTKYALQRAQLLFRISFLSLVTTRLSSHSFPQLHSALNSVDAERPQSSMDYGIEWVVPLQRNETSHWINAELCPAHRTLSVSGGLWSSGLASFLIDSEMSESAILWCKHPWEHFSTFILLS